MAFNYRFSNLLGTVYKEGNLLFTPDGNSVISPVGNRVSVYDLRSHKSLTLPVESRFNFTTLCLSPNGILLLAVNTAGDVHLISLISQTVLHKLKTHRHIACAAFSPDGKFFALTKENYVLVYRAPGPHNPQYNVCSLERVMKGAFDDTVTLRWSSCSRVLAVGSKDNTTRIYAMARWKNFFVSVLGGHIEPIVAIFFENKSSACYTLCRGGRLCVWKPSISLDDLEEQQPSDEERAKLNGSKKKGKKKGRKKGADGDDDGDDDDSDSIEGDMEDAEAEAEVMVASEEQSKKSKLFYKREARHFLRDALQSSGHHSKDAVTAADFSSTTHILVTGFSCGVFLIHELPEAQLIQSLSISDQAIVSLALNSSGDWIALGCQHLGQLLVWEWQSETFVMKQQGHFNNLACVAYSPDATNLATGGDDGKVKLWSVVSGQCFVTFTEHTSSVSGIVFSGKMVLSCSLDGTVRAYDMTRYRNFRTFTSPRPSQFGCISIDSAAELVAAGGVDIYEIFLWSIQTGRLLEVISAHEGPVSGLCFSPSLASSQLVTVSWDKTIRFWDALAVGSTSEALPLISDGTCVTFRPDGQEVAVATINDQITFFDTRTHNQTGCIEGKNDLTIGRSDSDLITSKKSKQAKGYFKSLCYSADGTCILAGGSSKSICIYHVKEMLLIRKFEITQNRSFDGMDHVINRKGMSEFGNMALVEDRDDMAGSSTIRLPGTKKGDMSSRLFRPEVAVTGLQFSPTNREFAATSTEGLLIFSQDVKMYFSPFELDAGVTPSSIRQVLAAADAEYERALIMALHLGEQDILREAFEQMPLHQADLIARNLPQKYVVRLLRFIAGELEPTCHLHFYSMWSKALLMHHGLELKRKALDVMPVLNLLQRNLALKTQHLIHLADRNRYSMQFLVSLAEQKKALAKTAPKEDQGSDEEHDEQLMAKWTDDEDGDDDDPDE